MLTCAVENSSSCAAANKENFEYFKNKTKIIYTASVKMFDLIRTKYKLTRSLLIIISVKKKKRVFVD